MTDHSFAFFLQNLALVPREDSSDSDSSDELSSNQPGLWSNGDPTSRDEDSQDSVLGPVTESNICLTNSKKSSKPVIEVLSDSPEQDTDSSVG